MVRHTKKNGETCLGHQASVVAKLLSAFTLGLGLTNPASADLLPSGAQPPAVKVLTAPLVSPTAAWTYYGPSTIHTVGASASVVSGSSPAVEATSAEIKAVATALGAAQCSSQDCPGYVQAVFEYVRKNIETEFRFGLSKGAKGAIIDRSGTPFDQADLMVRLLKEINANATYELGTISLTAAQFGKWTGLVNGLSESAQTFSVNAKAACQMLADGGIPATVAGSSDCSTVSGNLSTSGTPVTLGHVWVKVNGVLYDPSYKEHKLFAGADLPTAMGCISGSTPTCASQLLSIVGTPQLFSGTTSSVPGVGVYYLQGSGTMDTTLRSQLQTYGSALESYIKSTSASNKITLSINSVIPGKAINTAASLDFGTALPYPSTSQAEWAEVPDQFRTALRVQFENLDTDSTTAPARLYADELYGKRLRIADAPTSGGTGFRQTALYVDYRSIATSTATSAIPNPSTLTLTVNHPYAANAGQYADDQLARSINMELYFSVDGGTFQLAEGVATIIHGWGDASPSTIQHFSQLAAADEKAPVAADGGRLVPAQESLFENQQAVIAATVLAQSSQINSMISGVDAGHVQSHHSLGYLLSWPAQPSNGSVLTIESSISANSATATNSDRTAMIQSAAVVQARLEASVFEQMMDSVEGGSAPSLMAKSNQRSMKFVEVTDHNQYPGSIYSGSGESEISNYGADQIALIDSYLSHGYRSILVPQDYHMGTITSGTSEVEIFSINGIAAYSATGDRVAYIMGDYLKGDAGGSGSNDPAGDALKFSKNLDYSLKKRDSFDVSLASGDLTLKPTADLVSGAGDFPYALPFRRFYSSSSIAPGFCKITRDFHDNGCGVVIAPGPMPGVTGDNTDLGGGWYHNFEIAAIPGSDAFASFGRDSALSASGVVAALVALRGLGADLDAKQTIVAGLADLDSAWSQKEADTMPSKLAAILTTDWLASLLQNNIVTVKRPPETQVFTKLANGTSFAPPPGSTTKLVQSGYRYIDSFENLVTHWDTHLVSYSLTDPDGSTLAFDVHPSIRSDLWYPRPDRQLPSSWTFGNGVKVSFQWSTDGCLQKVSNNLGRALIFSTNFGCAQDTAMTVTDESGRQVIYTDSFTGHPASSLVGSPPTIPQWSYFKVQLPDGGIFWYDYLNEPTTAIERPYSRIYRWFTPSDASRTTPLDTVEFDPLYRVKAVTDSLSNRTEYFIGALFGDDNWKRGEKKDALGDLTTQYFNRYGSMVQNWDPLGRSTSFDFDDARRLVKVTQPEGNGTSYTYDARHNRRTATNFVKPGSSLPSNTTTFTYKEAETVLDCSSPLTCNRVASAQDTNGNTSTYDYDSTSGLLTEERGPTAIGSRTHYCYTSLTASGQTGAVLLLTGKISKVSSSEERVTSYTYDSADKLTLSTAVGDPASTLTEPSATSATCSTSSKSGALALTTTFHFDDFGNVSWVDGPRPGIVDKTTYDFDSMRRLTRVTSPSVSTVISGTTTSFNPITRYTYDKDGLLRTTRRLTYLTGSFTDSDPTNPWPTDLVAGQWSIDETRDYLATGDLASVQDASGDLTQYAYDAAGRTRVVTDPDGRQTATVYDAAGQAACTWRGGSGWASGSVLGNAPTDCALTAYNFSGPLRYSAYTYSDNGKQTSLQDGNGNQTDLQYDSLDRIAYTYFPDPTTGARCAHATESSGPTCSGGQTYEKLSYSDTSRCSGDPALPCSKQVRGDTSATIVNTYDAANRLYTKAPSGQATVTYAYNLLGEPNTVSKPAIGSSAAHSAGYTYDGAGRKATETNESRQVSYQYDEAGNRTRTTWPDGYYVQYTYDFLNRMTLAQEKGAREIASYTYDALSRRQDLVLAGQANNKAHYDYESNGNLNVLSQYLGSSSPVMLSYGHNGSGQITSITASDSFYLSSAPATNATVNYTPDKLNRYSAIGVLGLTALNPSYDARGNLLTWYSDNSTASKQTYSYDSENRLITAAVDASGNTSTYEYDALGRRQKKTVAPTAGGGSASVTQYLLDGDEEIAELDGSGVVQTRYVMGPAVDDRIARTDGSSTDTPNKLYYHANHQGSVVAMSDNTGAISCSSCQKFAYDEYGKLTSDLSSTQQQGEPFRYTGRRFDPETGLYYYRARYYAPQMGRFLQTDPIGYKDDLDLYAYVGNDPANKSDPSGSVIEISDVDREKVLRMINARSAGAFDVVKGKLVQISDGNSTGMGSMYYRDRLKQGINSSNTVKVEVGAHYTGMGGRKFDLNNPIPGPNKLGELGGAAGGRTELNGNDSAVHVSPDNQVIATLKGNMVAAPADTLMHELLGHAIPNAVGSDTGDAIGNENKARNELGMPLRNQHEFECGFGPCN